MKKYLFLLSLCLAPLVLLRGQTITDYDNIPDSLRMMPSPASKLKKVEHLPDFKKAIPLSGERITFLVRQYNPMGHVANIGIDEKREPIKMEIYYEVPDTLYYLATVLTTDDHPFRNEMMVAVPGRYWIRIDWLCGEVYCWNVEFDPKGILTWHRKFKIDCEAP
jgi:hypothetical protein